VEGSPNFLAYLALIGFPLVAVVLCATLRAPVAVPVILLVGQLFLPPVVALDAPVIPPLDKDVIPGLSALVGILIFKPRALNSGRYGRRYDLFMALLILGAALTAMTNTDKLIYGPKVLPAIGAYDFVADAIKLSLYWWIPFYFGRTLYKTSDDFKQLFVILTVAGLVYSLFLFIELRFSPQLNRWIYGFHQSEFQQTLRGTGYRPKAFMRHGLNVALFMVVSILAATALARAKQRVWRLPAWTVALYLVGVLALLKSAGALIFAAVCLPLMWFTRPKLQARAAAVLAVGLFSYPLLRAMNLIPVEDALYFFADIFGDERAWSLESRMMSEVAVLSRALERLWFGWGGYARPFIHDEITGKNLTVIDGFWAIVIGSRGVVGFVAIFGLLLLPVWRLRHNLSKLLSRRDQVLAAGLGLMAICYVADLIPNSSIDPYLTFLVGVLAGLGRGLEPPPGTAVPGGDDYQAEPTPTPVKPPRRTRRGHGEVPQ
jgi:hypothetical protein